MKDEVSIIVKTFERPSALERLLGSVLASSAAECRILVADASLHPGRSKFFDRGNIDYFRLPFDSGLSYGRNYLIDRVTTPYCLVLDDDLVFTQDTGIDILLNIVKEQGFDLAAGEGNLLVRGKPGYANIEIADRKMSMRAGATPRSYFNGLPVYDMVNNFFLATTDSLRDIRWDERFHIYGNHIDFFLRYSAKYKVTFSEKVVIRHEEGGYNIRQRNGKYGAGSLYKAARMFAQKHDVDQYGEVHLRGIRGFLDVYVPAARATIGRGFGVLIRQFQDRDRKSPVPH